MTDNTEQGKKESLRNYALKNLGNDSLRDLAVIHLIAENPNFGESDNGVVESQLYFPAVNSDIRFTGAEGNEEELIKSALLGSRQGNKRYTGQISEYSILEKASSIVRESLAYLTVDDVTNAIGMQGDAGNYGKKYIVDLLQGSEEEKKVAQSVIGSYLSYFISERLSYSYGMQAKTIPKGLEKILQSKP